MIKTYGVGGKIPTTTIRAYITQFSYRLLAKDLSGKGKKGTFG